VAESNAEICAQVLLGLLTEPKPLPSRRKSREENPRKLVAKGGCG